MTKKGGRKNKSLKTSEVFLYKSPSRLNIVLRMKLFTGFIQAIKLHKIRVIKPTK
tara:strand:+ start:589 stop:753 length:165 start_codon:yes stop_codon:yes gene_type:complete